MANPPTKSPTPSAAPASPTPASSTPGQRGASSPSSSNAGASAPLIAASHSPTPAQQNPQVKRPLAPTLPEADKSAPNPLKEMNDRQRQAIASRVQGYERQQVSDAGVDGAPTPPKAKSAGAASSSTPVAAAPAASAPTDSAPTLPDGSTPAAPETPATPAVAPEAKGPRYEPKAFKRWAEEHPEEAAELHKAVYGVEPKEGFIQLQNKGRKLKGEIRELRESTIREAETKHAAAKAEREKAEGIAGQLRWMGDMWEAAQKKDAQGNPIIDFDTADEAFRQNMGGISFDDYARQRARRGVSSPELAKERATRLRLEGELAQLRGSGQAKPAESAAAPAAPAPAAATVPAVNTEELWGSEVPKAHQLREFKGWADELHKEMQRHYDETLDEYGVDPEEIADGLLKRKLAAFTAVSLDTPAAAPKRVPGRPSTPKRRAEPKGDGVPDAASLTPKAAPSKHKVGHEPEDFDGNWSRTLARAAERHQARLRGEAVD